MMSKLQSVTGVMKTLAWMAREDFDEMEHKLYRIVFGVASFAAVALFWMFFLKNIISF